MFWIPLYIFIISFIPQDDLLPKKMRGQPRSLESMLMDAEEFHAQLQEENENRPSALTSDDFVNTGDAGKFLCFLDL